MSYILYRCVVCDSHFLVTGVVTYVGADVCHVIVEFFRVFLEDVKDAMTRDDDVIHDRHLFADAAT